jgi:putative transposase
LVARVPGKGIDAVREHIAIQHPLNENRVEWGQPFVVVGYVVMPEHVHLLISGPERGSLALALQMLNQNSSHKPRRRRRAQASQCELFPEPGSESHFWQKRYYDFNVRTEKKRIQKLKYMHRNPVTRGLVARPEEWRWKRRSPHCCTASVRFMWRKPIRRGLSLL